MLREEDVVVLGIVSGELALSVALLTFVPELVLRGCSLCFSMCVVVRSLPLLGLLVFVLALPLLGLLVFVLSLVLFFVLASVVTGALLLVLLSVVIGALVLVPVSVLTVAVDPKVEFKVLRAVELVVKTEVPLEVELKTELTLARPLDTTVDNVVGAGPLGLPVWVEFSFSNNPVELSQPIYPFINLSASARKS